MKDEDCIKLIMDYLCGKLDKDQACEFEKQLEKDLKLKDQYLLVKHLKNEAHEINWSEVDDAARAISTDLIEDFFKSEAASEEKRAIKVYDSKVLPLPEGVRPAVMDYRHMKFRCEEMSLNVTLYPISADDYEIMGRLLGYPKGKELDVELRIGRSILRTRTDTFYLFRFQKVPARDCSLTLKSLGEPVVNVDIKV